MYAEACSPIPVLSGPAAKQEWGIEGRRDAVQKRRDAENGTNARLCTTELLYHIFIYPPLVPQLNGLDFSSPIVFLAESGMEATTQ
jgi:hypothetical protein